MPQAKFILKLLVTIAVLAMIARTVDAKAVIDHFAGVRPLYMLAALGLGLGLVISDSLFWTAAMRALGHRLNLAPAFLFTIVGWFFGNIAPSTLGADVFRAAQMKRLGAPAGASIRIVLAARIMSFATLIAVIAAGLPLILNYAATAPDRLLAIAVFVGGLVALGVLAFFKPALARLPALSRLRISGKISRLSNDVAILLRPGRHAPGVWAFSALQHLLRIAIVGAIAAGLNAKIDVAALFAMVPIALLVAMIPISLGGWGVREASFIHFLGLAGLSPEIALAISLAFGLLRLVIGAVGGIIWVIARAEHYSFDVSPAPLPAKPETSPK
ncbi:MAG: lysylphosphatidylglycerol synthase transmembrane domain-containing protein [Parvularculaceae bacterium]